MSTIMTTLASLVTIVTTALGTLATYWVVAIPAAFFVIGLSVKFLFGLMGRGKKRRK